MKRIVALAIIAVFAGTGLLFSSSARAEGCYLCGSDSSNGCQQCRYGDKDTSEARKACAAKGCKVTGTASCSTAANVKVCEASSAKPDELPAFTDNDPS